jgi:hypothetical protein
MPVAELLDVHPAHDRNTLGVSGTLYYASVREQRSRS